MVVRNRYNLRTILTRNYKKITIIEEQDLIKQIIKGNQQAFEELYNLYKSKVYNTAIGYLQNFEDAEEVTQDVFTTIFRKAHTFKGNAKVSTWIYRITINMAINQIKKRSKQPTSELESQEILLTDFGHPGIQLENQEKSKHLFYAIDSLVEKQKTAFILSYIEGLPRQEVAGIMATSLKSVESLLQRAKNNLKKKLIDMYPEGNREK